MLGLSFADDGPPDEDPDPEELPELVAAELPPDEDLAGEPPSEPFGGLVVPVTVGTAVSYCTPLDSSA
jgi:hypothetical protein